MFVMFFCTVSEVIPDLGKEVYYALDDAEKDQVVERLSEENKRSSPVVQRFKGLGEMNATQLRETAMDPSGRRLVQLKISSKNKKTEEVMDMLLAKKRAGDRRSWLERKGDQAQIA